jgi:prolyl-tRNA editing enzyme YbaK/EbsC (Cys-tRNA(Pro) deacylase)
MVLNGVELASGSIRIHRSDIQERVMKRVGFPKELAQQRFGFLLEAFKYGAPPHGGFAIGFDRLVAMILGYTDIREVIAFPKNKSAECPMDGCPAEVERKQVEELHIKLNVMHSKKSEVIDKIKEMLSKEKKEFEVIEHGMVHSPEDGAKARGIEVKQCAKAYLLRADTGYAIAVISGPKEIDLVKLKAITKNTKLELASPDDIKRVTGCSLGAVPPFGHVFDVKTYVDKGLTTNEIIGFTAGSHTTSIKMHYKAFESIEKPVIGEFVK